MASSLIFTKDSKPFRAAKLQELCHVENSPFQVVQDRQPSLLQWHGSLAIGKELFVVLVVSEKGFCLG